MGFDEDVDKILQLKIESEKIKRDVKILKGKILDIDNDKLNFNTHITTHIKVDTLESAKLTILKDILIKQIESRFKNNDLSIFNYIKYNDLTKTNKTKIKTIAKDQTEANLKDLENRFYDKILNIKDIIET